MDCMTKKGEAERFAARLDEAMWERGMEPKAVANGTGLSHQTVLAYLRGERNPTMHAIIALCGCLEVSADWLLGLGA